MPPSTERAPIDAAAPVVEESVIRALVHKRCAENVLLTDIRACGHDHFVCAGQMPTVHPFFTAGSRTPREDILFYTELGRQASLAVTHAFLNVSLEDVFIFEKSEAAVTEAIWRSPLQSHSDSVAIEIKVKEILRRKNVVSRIVADHFMFLDDAPIFHGTGTWTIQSAALFKRLRRTSLGGSSPDAAETPTPVAAYTSLSQPTPINMVISAPEFLEDRNAVVASLIVDRTHPYFFDHPCDHVPGMLLLEGCAQLALAALAQSGVGRAARAAITGYAIDFAQFVECSLPTTLTARWSPADPAGRAGPLATIDIAISQRDLVSGMAKLSVGFAI
jgi:2-oxo-3-(phosphooxy)propyl 3-oxoalkanoate synthase